jgi:hypothetical protein
MARKPPTKVQTAKVSTAKSNKKAAAANTLKSALAYHAARENHDLLEGILHPDKNIPGNHIIAVSNDEFYSVPTADILERENAPAGRPQRVWINRDAQVWHFQKTTLKHAAPRPHVARALTDTEKCVLAHLNKSVEDLDKPLQKVIGGGGDDDAIWYLYSLWPTKLTDCLGERPKISEYGKRVEHVHTLRDFIGVFGRYP